jgi:hypothetical protein
MKGCWSSFEMYIILEGPAYYSTKSFVGKFVMVKILEKLSFSESTSAIFLKVLGHHLLFIQWYRTMKHYFFPSKWSVTVQVITIPSKCDLCGRAPSLAAVTRLPESLEKTLELRGVKVWTAVDYHQIHPRRHHNTMHIWTHRQCSYACETHIHRCKLVCGWNICMVYNLILTERFGDGSADHLGAGAAVPAQGQNDRTRLQLHQSPFAPSLAKGRRPAGCLMATLLRSADLYRGEIHRPGWAGEE